MTRNLLLLGTVVGALSFLSPAYANEVWLFDTPTGPQGQSHNYVGSAGTIINAQAFGPSLNGNPVQLYGKNGGTGSNEQGVGLTNDSTGAFEITVNSFVQLSTANLRGALNLSFQTDSTTSPDKWELIGSNTSGSDSGTILASCDSSTSSTCDVLRNINTGGFSFLDVTATAGNVLLTEVNTVPLPAALPLFATGLGGLGVLGWRRKRRAAALAA